MLPPLKNAESWTDRPQHVVPDTRSRTQRMVARAQRRQGSRKIPPLQACDRRPRFRHWSGPLWDDEASEMLMKMGLPH